MQIYLFARLAPEASPDGSDTDSDPLSLGAYDLQRLSSGAAVVDALLLAPAAMLVLLYGARRINRRASHAAPPTQPHGQHNPRAQPTRAPLRPACRAALRAAAPLSLGTPPPRQVRAADLSDDCRAAGRRRGQAGSDRGEAHRAARALLEPDGATETAQGAATRAAEIRSGDAVPPALSAQGAQPLLSHSRL